jgi:hypothetical protein
MERAEKCEKLRKRWRNSGPPESACRGRLQTTLERHWLKTVVVSVGGEGVPLSTSGMNQQRRAQANHRSGGVRHRDGAILI